MAAARQGQDFAEPGENGFELFDLSLTLGPGLVPWVSASSRLGQVHGIPRLTPDIPPVADLLDQVYDFLDAVRFAERDPLADLKQALRDLAFGESTVMQLFQATRGVAADHGRELLVRILASPHFAALPWELLPDPGKSPAEKEGSYLALAPDVSVVRLARGRTYPIRVERLEPPLNLLVVLSSPTGRDPADDSLAFDIYEERRALLAELEPLVKDGLILVDVEDQPTLQNLRRRIGERRRGYHLFHYLGHAEPDKLILEDESGRREDHSAARFMEVLRLCPDLRLAVFAGCETARAPGDPLIIDAAGTGDWRHILSLSDRCVQDSCPMVVGMQAVLPFRTERLFTRFFYQGIASGYSVTGALRLARGATRGDRHTGGDLLDWSVPALFLGGAAPGPLLDRAKRGDPPERPARHVLRIGLSQQETRFFARDVALRQAIDVLSGKTPERVLALTGPAGVGKTMLIDRALEDIEGPVCILYLRLEDIVPELKERRVRSPGAGEAPEEVKRLAEMRTDAPLESLCRLVAEMLTRADGGRREQEGRGPAEWWERLIEDIASRRFVLVVDDVDILVKQEEALIRNVVTEWVAQQVEKAPAGPKVDVVADLLEPLIAHVRDDAGGGATQALTNSVASDLRKLEELLGGSTAAVREVVAAVAERARGQIASRVQAKLPDTARGEVGQLSKLWRELKQGVRQGMAETRHEAQQATWREAARKLSEMRHELDRALRRIAERRSGFRLAVVGDRLPDAFLALRSDRRFVMRLGRLTWFETWRWIRRNLPGLLRYGEQYLARLWPRLGPDLALWEGLDRRILEAGTGVPDIRLIVDAIAPHRPSSRGERPGIDRPRGERPLRVAVAGAQIRGADALALAVTRLAAEHGVGGRAVADDADENERGSLAVLVEVRSPFGEGVTTVADLLKFFAKVAEHQPDILLLDYGSQARLQDTTDTIEREALRELFDGTLLIAAGGNSPRNNPNDPVTTPAIYPEVLAVGPINAKNQLQPYAELTPERSKPDILMRDESIGTALEGALAKGPDQTFRGSSFAAFHALGAAILVWSTLPDLSPDEVRGLLIGAAKSRAGYPPRVLSVEAAVTKARREVVRRYLKDGPCSLQTLAAISGLDPRLLSDMLEALIKGNNVRRLTRGRLERYEWSEDDTEQAAAPPGARAQRGTRSPVRETAPPAPALRQGDSQ